MILFIVTPRTRNALDKVDHVVTLQNDREGAKRAAHPHLLGNPDQYVVSPLTISGDRVTFATAGAWIQT